jgi:lipopolysaccharide/colanic/teichoic acid biosynthesis glycosyltransferase
MCAATLALYQDVIRDPVSSSVPLACRVRMIAKRALDVSLSGVGLIASSPLWALIALLIKLEDGGPVFYRQSGRV